METKPSTPAKHAAVVSVNKSRVHRRTSFLQWVPRRNEWRLRTMSIKSTWPSMIMMLARTMIWPFGSEIYFWSSMTGLPSIERRWPIRLIFQSERLVVSERLQNRTERIHSSLVRRSSRWSECQRVGDQWTHRSISFSAFRWFHADILRKEAERLLLNPVNPRGTFLVRKSENAPGSSREWRRIARSTIFI